MNKTSVHHAASYMHQGEFLASGTVWNFAACVEDTHDYTSSEGVEYVHNVRYLKQVNTAALAKDGTMVMYMGYKWPTEDDYNEFFGKYADRIVDAEGIIGLQMMPGVRIQEYIGTDYTENSTTMRKLGALAPLADTSAWILSYGTQLFLTDSGQFTNAVTNEIVRAQFIEKKGDWVTIELLQPYKV